MTISVLRIFFILTILPLASNANAKSGNDTLFFNEEKYQKYLDELALKIKEQKSQDPTQFVFDLREKKSDSKKLCDVASNINIQLNSFYNYEPKTLAYYVLLIETDFHLFFDEDAYAKAFSLQSNEIQIDDINKLKQEVGNIKDRFKSDIVEKANFGEEQKFVILSVYNFQYFYDETNFGWEIDPMVYFDQDLEKSFIDEYYSKVLVKVPTAYNGVSCSDGQCLCNNIGDQILQIIPILEDLKDSEQKNFLQLLSNETNAENIIGIINRLSAFNIKKIDPALRIKLLGILANFNLKETNGGESAAVKLLQNIYPADASKVLSGLNQNLLLFNLIEKLDDEGIGASNYTNAVFATFALIQTNNPYDGNADKLLTDKKSFRWNGDGFFDGTNYVLSLNKDGQIHAVVHNGDMNYEEVQFDPYAPIGIISTVNLPGISMQSQDDYYEGIVPGIYLYWLVDKAVTKNTKVLAATGVNLLAMVTGVGVATQATGLTVRIIGTFDVLSASASIALDITSIESKIVAKYGDEGQSWVNHVKTILFIYNTISAGANLLKLPQELDNTIAFWNKSRQEIVNAKVLPNDDVKGIDDLLNKSDDIAKTINAVDDAVSSIKASVLQKISKNSSYSLLFSDSDLGQLVGLGKELNLVSDEIEAFVLAHCRRAKQASLSDMSEVMKSITSKNLNNNIGFKPGWNMMRAYKESQNKMASGGFLDPSSYLTSSYIENHLSQFYGKASYFVNKSAYDTYIFGRTQVGVVSDNSLFVSSAKNADVIINNAGQELNMYEKLLGFSEEHFSFDGQVWRIDVKNPQNFNLRIPNGNEMGANHWWHPGGYTSGGSIEAVTNVIPKVLNGEQIVTEINILK